MSVYLRSQAAYQSQRIHQVSSAQSCSVVLFSATTTTTITTTIDATTTTPLNYYRYFSANTIPSTTTTTTITITPPPTSDKIKFENQGQEGSHINSETLLDSIHPVEGIN